MHNNHGYLFLKWEPCVNWLITRKTWENRECQVGALSGYFSSSCDGLIIHALSCVPKLSSGQRVDVTGQDKYCDVMYKTQCWDLGGAWMPIKLCHQLTVWLERIHNFSGHSFLISKMQGWTKPFIRTVLTITVYISTLFYAGYLLIIASSLKYHAF